MVHEESVIGQDRAGQEVPSGRWYVRSTVYIFVPFVTLEYFGMARLGRGVVGMYVWYVWYVLSSW